MDTLNLGPFARQLFYCSRRIERAYLLLDPIGQGPSYFAGVAVRIRIMVPAKPALRTALASELEVTPTY